MCFDQNAACLAWTDEKVIGPAQVYGESCHFLDGVMRGKAGKQRNPDELCGRYRRTDEDAEVKTLAGCGVPLVIAAATTLCLFICYVEAAIRRAVAGFGECVGVGAADGGEVMQAAGEDRSVKRGFDCGEIQIRWSGMISVMHRL